MSKKPAVYIDVDNCLVNFLKRYSEYYIKDTGRSVDWQDIPNYDLAKSMNTPQKYKYLYDEAFYDNIEFMPGAVEAVEKLHTMGHDVKFITAAVTLESMVGKFKLLRRTFGWFHIERNWIVTSRKQHVVIPHSIIVDDNPHFFKESRFPCNICYAWPHNKHVEEYADLYTSNWDTIYKFIVCVSSRRFALRLGFFRRVRLWIDSKYSLLNPLTR